MTQIEANIFFTMANIIQSLTAAGYTRESVVEAVTKKDFSLLEAKR